MDWTGPGAFFQLMFADFEEKRSPLEKKTVVLNNKKKDPLSLISSLFPHFRIKEI